MKITLSDFLTKFPNATKKDFDRYYKGNIKVDDLKCFSPTCNNIRKVAKVVSRGFDFFCSKDCEQKNLDIKRKIIGERISKSNLLKYGVISTAKLDTVKEKAKQTCLLKYGLTSPGQSEKIKEKAKQSNLKKYGVTNPMKFLEIKNKFLSTIKKKYDIFPQQKHLKNFEFWNNKTFWEYTFFIDKKFDLYKCMEFFNCAQVIAHQKLKEFNIDYKKHYGSLQQDAISNLLISLDLKIVTNTKDIIPPLELDIWLPELGLAIEYNGSYWHSYHPEVGTSPKQSDYEYQRTRHQQKSLACYKAGIRLLHIYEEEDYTQKLYDFIMYEETKQDLYDLDTGCYPLGLEYQVMEPESKDILKDRVIWNAGKIKLKDANGSN